MKDVLARNWGWVALRGGAALVFGIITLLNQSMSLNSLIVLFGAYAALDGVFMIMAAAANRHDQPGWGMLVVGGVLAIAIGILAYIWPPVWAMALLLLIALWAIVIGVAQVAAAIRLRRLIPGEWILVLDGLLSVVFGSVIAAFPGADLPAVLVWIGAHAIAMAILLIMLAIRLRRWHRAQPAV